jgi:hypothetical protein
MLSYLKDMEIRGKYGNLEKRVLMLGRGKTTFSYLKDYHRLEDAKVQREKMAAASN